MIKGFVGFFKSLEIEQQLVVILNSIVFVLSLLTIIGLSVLDASWYTIGYWIFILFFSFFSVERALREGWYKFVLNFTVYAYALVLIPLGYVSTGSITLPIAVYANIAFFSLNFVANRTQRLIINPYLILFVLGYMFYEYDNPDYLFKIPQGKEMMKYYIAIVPLSQLVFAFAGIAFIKAYRSRQADLEEKNLELERLMRIDTLTNLYNKQYLNEQLKVSIAMAKRDMIPVSLIMIDVDFFKNYNDRYGHIKGDECLVEIAEILLHLAKRDSDMAFRFGGEEFVLLLNNTDIVAAGVVAERLLEAVAGKKIEHLESEITDIITLSAGVSAYNGSGEMTSDRLVMLGDKALYQAKRAGRNRFCIADNGRDEVLFR